MDSVECCFADASGGGVDDAEEGDGVGWVGDDAEVGDCVFDFFAVEERGASGDAVGDGVLAHRVFDDTGEGVGSVEDGHVFPRDVVVFIELAEPVANEIGFVSFVVAGDDGDGVATGLGGEEGFVFAFGVVLDECVGGVQNWFCRAEVLSEHDDLGAGVVFFEVEDVGDVGAAPAVDGLVGVSDDADIGDGGFVFHAGERRRGGGEEGGDLELDGVGVLVFVDE